MATALEIVSGSLKLLGVTAAEASNISPTEAQDGLNSLNDMMSAWEEKQIFLGFIPIVDVDDQVIVPRSVVGGIKSNFAVYVAPEYDRVVTPALALRARREYKDIRAAFVRIDNAEFPDTLPRGSGNKLYDVSDGDKPNEGIEDTFYPRNPDKNF